MLTHNGVVIAAVIAAAVCFAGSASAEESCKLNGPGHKGIAIKPNQLVRFNTNLNGEKQYSGGTVDELSWAKDGGTVFAPKGCSLTVYMANGSHIRPKAAAYKIPAGSRGVGCNCE